MMEKNLEASLNKTDKKESKLPRKRQTRRMPNPCIQLIQIGDELILVLC